MLQIISGKFFDGDDRYHTDCKAVLYSNASFRGIHPFAHINMEPTDLNNEFTSYIVSYDNQLQKTNSSLQFVKVGDEEIVFQFKNILAFALDCIVDEEKSNIDVVCAVNSTGSRRVQKASDYLNSTVSKKKVIEEENLKQADKLITHLISLSRQDYINILNCIVAYNASIRLLGTDVSLAYSMLVYCLESLAQKYDNYIADWEDYNQDKKIALERVFSNLQPSDTEKIKIILIKDEHFKLSQRFRSFATSNLGENFFSYIPDRQTICKDDFNIALQNAYVMRSQYAHMLDPLKKQLTDGNFSKSHDIMEFQHNVYFTYGGLIRVVREVICNFIVKTNSVVKEKIDWQGELPNMFEAELAPYFWINKQDYPNAKYAKAKFEGFVECIVYYPNKIPQMDELIQNYLCHLAEMSPENKSVAFALSYLYYSKISNISEPNKALYRGVIESNFDLLKDINIYNAVVYILMVEMPKDLQWTTTEFLKMVEAYRKKKYNKGSIKLPREIELLLYLTLANSYKDDYDTDQQKIWLEIAYFNANNLNEVQDCIKKCIESTDLFDLNIIWNNIYSIEKLQT